MPELLKNSVSRRSSKNSPSTHSGEYGREEGSERSNPLEERLEGRSFTFLRSPQPRGLTMNHSTNSAHRSSSSKRNVHRFQKNSPFV
jgi:hypothetical protein